MPVKKPARPLLGVAERGRIQRDLMRLKAYGVKMSRIAEMCGCSPEMVNGVATGSRVVRDENAIAMHKAAQRLARLIGQAVKGDFSERGAPGASDADE